MVEMRRNIEVVELSIYMVGRCRVLEPDNIAIAINKIMIRIGACL